MTNVFKFYKIDLTERKTCAIGRRMHRNNPSNMYDRPSRIQHNMSGKVVVTLPRNWFRGLTRIDQDWGLSRIDYLTKHLLPKTALKDPKSASLKNTTLRFRNSTSWTKEMKSYQTVAMLISTYCVTSRQYRLTINTSASQAYIYSVTRHSPSVVWRLR